jgi:hypothetical protein
MKATMLPEPKIAATGGSLDRETTPIIPNSSGRVQINMQITAAPIDPIAKPKSQIKLTMKVMTSHVK